MKIECKYIHSYTNTNKSHIKWMKITIFTETWFAQNQYHRNVKKGSDRIFCTFLHIWPVHYILLQKFMKPLFISNNWSELNMLCLWNHQFVKICHEQLTEKQKRMSCSPHLFLWNMNSKFPQIFSPFKVSLLLIGVFLSKLLVV